MKESLAVVIPRTCPNKGCKDKAVSQEVRLLACLCPYPLPFLGERFACLLLQ